MTFDRIIYYEGGLAVLLSDDGTEATVPDRELSDAAFYADARLIEHGEMDCGGGRADGLCNGCKADLTTVNDVRRISEDRERRGVTVEDRFAPTLEERLGPYGIEWQLEQRERMEGLA